MGEQSAGALGTILTSIPSTSVAALLAGLEYGQAFLPGVVLVLDEAGMADTRQLSAVLEHVRAFSGKLVLVGDGRQLAAIGAGGAFTGLVRRGIAVQLTENRQQTNAWGTGGGRAPPSGSRRARNSLHQANHCLVVASSGGDAREPARDRLVAAGDPDPAVTIALRRADVADLDERARDRMRNAGTLGSAELELAYLPAGEPVRVRLGRVGATELRRLFVVDRDEAGG